MKSLVLASILLASTFGHAVTYPKRTNSQKAVDDRCFVAYSHAAGDCNSAAANDDAEFTKCLAPIKKQLKRCCAKGGSKACAENAK